MLEFEVKAVVADPENPEQDSTVYLFNKEQGILLPIKMTSVAASHILDAHNSGPEARPHIHDTAIRIIKALEAEVVSVAIHAYHSEIFYSYIRIRTHKDSMEIDAKPSDAIAIALRHKVPVLVNEKVYEIVGIRITRELLKSYL